MPIPDIFLSEQPRERLQKYGPNKLFDFELLAIILRTGMKGVSVISLAKKILQKYPGSSLSNANFQDLKLFYGLGSARACEVVAVFELGRRMLKDKITTLILSPRQVWEELSSIRMRKKEHFVVFYLDTQSQVIKHEVVSVGTLSSSLIHPREVFEPAIKHLASHVILAHNHPAGSLKPSQQDELMTKRLVDCGKLLGIEVVDHVIVSKDGYVSMKEINLF